MILQKQSSGMKGRSRIIDSSRGLIPTIIRPSAKDMAKIQESQISLFIMMKHGNMGPRNPKTLQEGNVHTIKATEGMLLLPGSEEGHDHDHEHGKKVIHMS